MSLYIDSIVMNILTDHKKHKKLKSNPSLKMTSFKAHESIAERFAHEAIRNKMTMQKVLNRSMDLYINDVDFRNKINTHTALLTSGSL